MKTKLLRSYLSKSLAFGIAGLVVTLYALWKIVQIGLSADVNGTSGFIGLSAIIPVLAGLTLYTISIVIFATHTKEELSAAKIVKRLIVAALALTSVAMFVYTFAPVPIILALTALFLSFRSSCSKSPYIFGDRVMCVFVITASIVAVIAIVFR